MRYFQGDLHTSSAEERKCRLELCRKTKTRAAAECTAIGYYYMMHPLDGCYMPTAPCKNPPPCEKIRISVTKKALIPDYLCK